MPYTTATVTQKDQPTQDGRVHFVATFTGAGEVDRQFDYTIDENTTTLAIKQWRDRMIAALNGKKSVVGVVNVGDVIAAAPAAPDTSVRDGWLADAARLVRMQAIVNAGGMSPTNAEFLALKTSVTNGYLAAYAPFI